jgi:hypothetical protein
VAIKPFYSRISFATQWSCIQNWFGYFFQLLFQCVVLELNIMRSVGFGEIVYEPFVSFFLPSLEGALA